MVTRNSQSDSATDVRSNLQMSEMMFSVADAGKVLGVSKSKLYELIAEKRLKTIALGRRRLVPGAKLAEYIKELTARAA